MNKIDFIKSRLTVQDYLLRRGIPCSVGKNIRCPLGEHEDKNPSFSIFQDGSTTRFKCFSCGKTGDVIDLAECFGESLDDLHFRLGGKSDFVPTPMPPAKSTELDVYLSGRKVDPKKVAEFIGFKNNCLIIPIVDQFQKEIGSQSRSLEKKVFKIDGSSGFFYSDNEPKGRLVIVEGVMDYLSVRQYYPHVLGILSATSSVDCANIINRYQEVIWAGDEDSPGKKQLSNFLAAHPQADVRQWLRPHDGDVNDNLSFLGEKIIPSLLESTGEFRPGIKTYSTFQQIASDAFIDACRTQDLDIISFGHKVLDDAVGGVFPQSLVVIGADTGAGKSQMLGNMAYRVAKSGKKVYYFDLENDNGDFYRRQMLIKLRSRGHSLRMRDLRTSSGLEGIGLAYGECQRELEMDLSDNLHFYRNQKIPTLEDMLQYIGEIESADLICIDHLHYFDLTNDENQSSQLGRIMRQFRILTRERRIPIITVSHLRKRNKNDEPSNDDIFGSSNIAKEAETVILLWRQEDDDIWNARVKITKNRNEGIIRTFYAKYEQSIRDFSEMTERPYDNDRI